MLRSIKNLIGYPVEAKDGRLGKVKDCLFDDRHWRIRYVVVDTGRWLPGKKTLVSPHHVEEPELGWHGKRLPIDLTQEQIENSPELDHKEPVSAQYEEEYARYYRHLQPYWSGPYAWGMADEPFYSPSMAADRPSEADAQAHEFNLRKIEHSHLRSSHEIMGYRIDAQDEAFGHVEDFIVDAKRWKLQYLVVDTRNWLPGKKSLIDIGWVDSFNWDQQSAVVSLSKKQIEIAPEFDPNQPINRDYEQRLYDFYGRPYHWEEPHVTTPPY